MAKATIDVSTKTFVRFWGVIAGLALIILLLWRASGALMIIGIAAFIAIAANPLVRKIDNKIPGDNRKLASALAYVLIVGVVAAFLAIVLPAIVGETVRFVGTLPSVAENFDWGVLNDIGRNFGIADTGELLTEGVASFSDSFVSNFGGIVIESAAAAGLFIANTILVLVLAFLMLIEGPKFVNWFWKFLDGFFKTKEDSKLAKKTLSQMTETVGKFVSGELIVAMINWGMTTLVLTAICLVAGINVGLALSLGMITALFSLVPIFGSILGGLIVAVLLSFSNWGAGLAFLAYYLVYAQFEGNIIYPKIQSSGLHMPMLVVLAAVTIGIYMFGILGALIAVPVAASLRVLFTNYMVRDKKE